MEPPLRTISVSEIWIDDDGRLCVRLADPSLDLTYIYRASASGGRALWHHAGSNRRG